MVTFDLDFASSFATLRSKEGLAIAVQTIRNAGITTVQQLHEATPRPPPAGVEKSIWIALKDPNGMYLQGMPRRS